MGNFNKSLIASEETNGNIGIVHNCIACNGPCDCVGSGDNFGNQVPKDGKTADVVRERQKGPFKNTEGQENAEKVCNTKKINSKGIHPGIDA